MNAALATSSLASLEGEFRYIPIIMPLGMLTQYPARSKLQRRSRVYNCCPQLAYDVFVTGSFEGQVTEYLGGILRDADKISGFGATSFQIAEFQEIISAVTRQVIDAQLDQTRH